MSHSDHSSVTATFLTLFFCLKKVLFADDCLVPANIICSFFMVDIPEEEARYWTYKLEQINALADDNEVGTALFAILRDGAISDPL